MLCMNNTYGLSYYWSLYKLFFLDKIKIQRFEIHLYIYTKWVSTS